MKAEMKAERTPLCLRGLSCTDRMPMRPDPEIPAAGDHWSGD